MDAARMAKRSIGVDNVVVIYRRSISEMPCDREELEMASRDGIAFMFLASPESFVDGILRIKQMELGEEDASGRRRPIETGKTFDIECSYLISAIGEKADPDVLKALTSDDNTGVYLIGDAKTGPSTVVRCIASAREAVDTAIEDVYKKMLESSESEDEEECSCIGECTCNSQEVEDDLSLEELEKAENSYFESILDKKSKITQSISGSDSAFLAREASRCVECSYLCNKCVDVCPNRANVALDMRASGLFDDPFQILHLDAYCNECGNCATFCSHAGKPYLDKFTLFSRLDDFEASKNSGFIVIGSDVRIRLDGKLITGKMSDDCNLDADVPDEVKAIIEEVFYSYSYLLGAVEE